MWRQFLEEKQKGGSAAPTEAPEEYECPPKEFVSYYMPSDTQCDKYVFIDHHENSKLTTLVGRGMF